jgi:four helix bundle protein
MAHFAANSDFLPTWRTTKSSSYAHRGWQASTMVRTHKDLLVWRKAVTLASRIYELTARFPSYDRQTLSTQMRRCAVSVASNIAEGAARGSRAEYIRFLDIARGSLSELETQICICLDLQFISTDAKIEELVAETGRLLTALVRRLREHRERARGFENPLRPPNSH